MLVSSPPVTSQESERVWKSQARPSARSVAIALTHAGRPVHFTTVARWKRQGLLTIGNSHDPLVAGIEGVQTAEPAEPQAGPEDPFAELPLPVTPLETKRVWEEQSRPSARSVAKALTRAGRPCGSDEEDRPVCSTVNGGSDNQRGGHH